MHEQSDQMVLEYLGRVGDVARRRLRSDERLDFMNRLRRRIDETRTVTGAVEPDEVRRVIVRFGDPSRLVEREFHRLEQARATPVPPAPARAEPTEPTHAEPTLARPAEAQPTQPAPPEPAHLEDGRVATEPPAPESDRSTQPIPAVPDSIPSQSSPWTQQSRPSTRPGQTPTSAAPWARRGQSTAGREGKRVTAEQEAQDPGGAVRPGYEGPPTYEETGRTLPGMPGLGETMSSVNPRDLVRERRLETAAIILLGLGGLVVPFPYTFVPLLIGAVCLAVSRTWTARDKLYGLLAPVAGLFLGVFVVGAATGSDQVPVDIAAYAGAATGHGMTFVRVGALAGAGYLAFRLFRKAAGPGEPPGRTTGSTGP